MGVGGGARGRRRVGRVVGLGGGPLEEAEGGGVRLVAEEGEELGGGGG